MEKNGPEQSLSGDDEENRGVEEVEGGVGDEDERKSEYEEDMNDPVLCCSANMRDNESDMGEEEENKDTERIKDRKERERDILRPIRSGFVGKKRFGYFFFI